jgi:CBS domain-containing protein
MKVKDIMTSEARCIGPEENLTAAAALMRQLDVGALPVCANDRLAGMITDRDITIRAVAESRDPAATPVSMVMSPDIIYTFDDQDVKEAARIMETNQIRRLPVLNRSKRLVGMLSLGDVAKEGRDKLSGEALREISQPSSAH